MPLPSGFATLRDLVLFTLGAGVLLYAVVLRDPPTDPVAVMVGVTLCGLPMVTLGPRGFTRDDQAAASSPDE